MPANDPPKATLDQLNQIQLKPLDGGAEFPAVQLWAQKPCLVLLVRRPGTPSPGAHAASPTL